jgi:hypothetical protein
MAGNVFRQPFFRWIRIARKTAETRQQFHKDWV